MGRPRFDRLDQIFDLKPNCAYRSRPFNLYLFDFAAPKDAQRRRVQEISASKYIAVEFQSALIAVNDEVVVPMALIAPAWIPANVAA